MCPSCNSESLGDSPTCPDCGAGIFNIGELEVVRGRPRLPTGGVRMDIHTDMTVCAQVERKGDEIRVFWDGRNGDGNGGFEFRLDLGNARALAGAILRIAKETK